MKKYKVQIEGVTPYMQHRMDTVTLDNWEKNRKLVIERPDVSQEDVVKAEFFCYRNKNGSCFIPSEHLQGSFINAGGYVKSKVGNARKSMKNIVAGMFSVEPDEILLPDWDEIDKRTATNRAMKGKIIVVRPKWTKWAVEFELQVDNDTITKETIEEIITNAGNYCGIGSFRPTNNGKFGRFKLISLSAIGSESDKTPKKRGRPKIINKD